MKKRSEFLDTILEYNPNYDIELIGRAYDVAEEMHRGQLRKSGEPYLIHPMAVAEILADLGMDEETIVAGLLHDVVEDTEYTEEDLNKTGFYQIREQGRTSGRKSQKDVSRYVEGYKGFNYKAFGQAAQPEDYQLYDSRQDNRKVQRNT